MRDARAGRSKQSPLGCANSKIHAADCADCETKEEMLDRIESDLEFVGRLTQKQRSKLLEIAEKCPVHRTLVSEIDIRTRVL
jgi:putative redox protein